MTEKTKPPVPIALRVKAIESLLIERDLIDPQVIDEMIDMFENRIGPRDGARVVARAWCDPVYKARLLADGKAAVDELGFSGGDAEFIVVTENTPEVHNAIVCTLCSCYPWNLLGLPPGWYKASAYRSRMVLEPRAVIAELGYQVPEDVEVRVWDANAELRYMVLPMQPPESVGLSEDELVDWVTRDSMIGVGLPRRPASTSTSAGEPA
ncbi:nitrile hydratase subunit alpha [Variovorax sp. J31P207]|uniref:nitrile hydratase subunit alpha n=1 Tax=Variovorax sp. J31P207 TaxID=3053510 RepID=UPI0025753C17|nr:nitrile hydratase subunit alpha [Variovorax sp. J31P207]MDM0071517.1 nitrile hydratase subunit alpha [Variovorax sp. J31P207]